MNQMDSYLLSPVLWNTYLGIILWMLLGFFWDT